ncbi:4'-phosphopantetheinyl transferase [Conyzicola nivalis]|uniref:4'-phosphopantetheinyl transferase n=1 Tax=Conyzicola nivalis TaxID=1477021 RepID=A0ABV2QPJ6_9MICO
MDDPVVLVRQRGDRDADRALLAEAAALALGVASGVVASADLASTDLTNAEVANADVAGVVVTRTCAHCGGTDHGQPSAPGVFLSLSRAGGLVAVAASLHRAVGIDIERLDRVARAGFDDVAFTAEERAEIAGSADPHALRAVLWTSKEALLKLCGDGLRTDPRLLRVSGARRLLAWPASAPRLHGAGLTRLDTPPGYVGTLAVSG